MKCLYNLVVLLVFFSFGAHVAVGKDKVDADKIITAALEAELNGNSRRAIDLIFPLALKGHSQAQFELAQFYLLDYRPLSDEGMRRNFDLAVHWLRQAAAQGHRLAMVELAHNLYHGYPETRDRAEAQIWIDRVSKFDDREVYLELGRLYAMFGERTAAEVKKAKKWLTLAVERRSTFAGIVLNRLAERYPKHF